MKALSVRFAEPTRRVAAPVWELGEDRLRVQEARALTDDADLKLIWERLHQARELLEDVRRVEVLPVEREDERSLATRLKALPHRGLEQGDAVRGGERGDEHEVLGALDVVLNALEVRAARVGCEELHVHIDVPARTTFGWPNPASPQVRLRK